MGLTCHCSTFLAIQLSQESTTHNVISQNIYFRMKNLIHAMMDMNVTNSLKASIFFMKISQVVAFGGLGEDQNISLATERWNLNNRWKTPLAVRHIAKLSIAIETFFKTVIGGVVLYYADVSEF